MNKCFSGFLASMTVAVCSSHAQLIVDAGGPHNLFYAEKADTGLPYGLDISLKPSSTPSVNLDYFRSDIPSKWLLGDTPGAIVLGADLQATAIDGIMHLDRRPQLDFSAIANVSWEGAWLYSLTTRGTTTWLDYALFDKRRPAGAEFFSRGWVGESVAETFSTVPACLPKLGLAVSLGYAATNNYTSLPRITFGKGLATSGTQVAATGESGRFGAFNSYNAMPMMFLPTYLLDQQGLSDFLAGFPKIFGLHLLSPENKYGLVVGPYGSFVPRDEGKPTHSIGLNLVVESLGPIPKDKLGREVPAKQPLTFPFAIFVERQNAFAGKPATSIGAALMYHFP